MPEQVKLSLEAANLAQSNASLGIYEASAGMSHFTCFLVCAHIGSLPTFLHSKELLTKILSHLLSVSSRQARSLAEDAFFHPSIMSVSYYSFEHCFAVYSVSNVNLTSL